MVLKLVMGFTDTLNEDYHKDDISVNTADNGNFVGSSIETLETYRSFTVNSADPKVFVEWILDKNTQFTTKVVSIFQSMQPYDIINTFNCINTIKYVKKTSSNPEKPVVGVSSLIFPLNVNDENLDFPLLESSDFDDMVTTQDLGDLEIELSEIYGFNLLEPEVTIQWAFVNNNTDNLINFASIPNICIVPSFYVEFDHDSNFTGYTTSNGEAYTQWLENNRTLLESKGYDLTSNFNKMGSITIGSLVGDKEDAYQKVTANPYICSIQIVEE